jgi:tight adherence protein B
MAYLLTLLAIGLIVAAAAAVLAPDLLEAYRRYTTWVSGEVKEQLGFLNWRVQRDQVERLLDIVLAGAFAMGALFSFNPMGGLFLAGLVGFIPVPLVRFLKARRWRAFDLQFLDGVNLLRNAMKSGLTLQQAIDVLVREMQPPISEEFDRLLKEVQLGRTVEEALTSLNERIGHPELDLVTSAVVTLRKTGGNLAETFEVISITIQERTRVEGKIRALTAQGMTQAYVLVAMPFILGIIMFLLDPAYMTPMFSTVLGLVFLAFVVLLVSMGWLIIKKIVTIEV